MFKEIWELQADLNKNVYGIDTEGMRTHPTADWLAWQYRYLDEAVNELVEAKENFYHKWWTTETKKSPELMGTLRPDHVEKFLLELIDVTHFLVSAAHITMDSAMHFSREVSNPPILVSVADEPSVYKLLNTAIKSCLNKRPAQAMSYVIRILSFMGVDGDKLLVIYKEKHRVNTERQKRDYNLKNKTEDDNEKIEKIIAELVDIKGKKK